MNEYFLIAIIGWVFWRFKKGYYYNDQIHRIDDLAAKIVPILEADFLIGLRPQCDGNRMTLNSISPHGSISYSCSHCKNKMHASPLRGDPAILTDYWIAIRDISLEAKLQYWDAEIKRKIQFSARPYEQNIPSNEREEAWQKDINKCIEFRPKDSTQSDHIIRLSQNGPTTTEDPQIDNQDKNDGMRKPVEESDSSGFWLFLFGICGWVLIMILQANFPEFVPLEAEWVPFKKDFNRMIEEHMLHAFMILVVLIIFIPTIFTLKIRTGKPFEIVISEIQKVFVLSLMGAVAFGELMEIFFHLVSN